LKRKNTYGGVPERSKILKCCTKCGKLKKLAEFKTNRWTKSGYGSRCIICDLADGRRRYNQNIEKERARSALYRKTYAEKNRQRGKDYYLRNRDKLLAKKCEYHKKYAPRRRLRERERMRDDVEFRLKKGLRCRIYYALRRDGIVKSKRTEELISCSIEFLRGYLQAKFYFGMTWKNYGKWHIDHKKPCVSFDLTDPEQQKKCFHYTNLRPLWAQDNFHKGAKVI